jgi:hypothetical protein
MSETVVQNKQPNVLQVNSEDFDTGNPVRNVAFKLIVHPILNLLPAATQKHARKTHRMANEVVEYKTSYRALEVLYSGGYGDESKNILEHIAHALWNSTDNAKGVRNRLIIVETLIENKLRELLDRHDVTKLHLLSIASGSARAYITVLHRLSLPSNINISLTFLDKSPQALRYSKALLKDYPLPDNCSVTWVEGTANDFLRKATQADKRFDIVEMVGLMDYFDDAKVIETMRSIHACLSERGCLVTANIMPNIERPFVTKVVGWDMKYRTPDQFVELVCKGGFSKDRVAKVIEPMNVHTLVNACK